MTHLSYMGLVELRKLIKEGKLSPNVEKKLLDLLSEADPVNKLEDAPRFDYSLPGPFGSIRLSAAELDPPENADEAKKAVVAYVAKEGRIHPSNIRKRVAQRVARVYGRVLEEEFIEEHGRKDVTEFLMHEMACRNGFGGLSHRELGSLGVAWRASRELGIAQMYWDDFSIQSHADLRSRLYSTLQSKRRRRRHKKFMGRRRRGDLWTGLSEGYQVVTPFSAAAISKEGGLNNLEDARVLVVNYGPSCGFLETTLGQLIGRKLKLHAPGTLNPLFHSRTTEYREDPFGGPGAHVHVGFVDVVGHDEGLISRVADIRPDLLRRRENRLYKKRATNRKKDVTSPDMDPFTVNEIVHFADVEDLDSNTPQDEFGEHRGYDVVVGVCPPTLDAHPELATGMPSLSEFRHLLHNSGEMIYFDRKGIRPYNPSE